MEPQIRSLLHISRLLAAWLGEAKPFQAQPVVRETLNYASEKGGGCMAVGCNGTPSSFTSFSFH